MVKFKVLSTKKIMSPLVQQVREKGIDIVEVEFIKVVPVEIEAPLDLLKEKKDVVYIFTSKNAVVNAPGDEKIKVFCLSGATKAAVEEKFPDAIILDTADNAKELAEKIIRRNVQEVIFFCGNKRRDELPTALEKAGVKVREVIVYKTIKTPVALNDDFDAVLFFSPSAVSSFYSVNQLKDDAICFAIGDTTADAIKNHVNNIVVCKAPTQEEMIAELLRHCE